MKKLKILGVPLFASLLVPFCAGAAMIGTTNYDVETPINETESHISTPVRNVRNATPTSEPTEIDGEEVKVSINKSQTTSNSQSYQVEFSTEILTYTDKENQCFIKVEEDMTTLTELPEIMYYADEKNGTDPIMGEELTKFKTEHEQDWAELLRDPTDAELPSYAGVLYKMKNFSKKNKDVVVPNALRYTNKFIVNVVEIGYDVIDHKKDHLLESITIPESVVTINPGAFTFPEKVLYEGTEKEETVKNTTCQINIQGEKKSGFYDGFAEYPENVKYNQEYEYNDGDTPLVYGAAQSFGKPSARYILGIKSKDYNYPLIATFDIKKANGEIQHDMSVELNVTSTQNPYDGVGSGVGGASFVRNVDIDVEEGSTILDETLVFRNIFKAESKDDTWVPDLTVEYKATPKLEFTSRAFLSDFIKYSFSSVSKYMGYSTITLNVEFFQKPYEIFKPGIYGANEAKILSGDYYVRYRFTALSAMVYSFDYKGANGELKHIDAKVETPPNQMICNQQGSVTFLFEDSAIADDFKIENVVKLDLLGLTITLDLFAKGGGRATTRSEFSSRFARTNVINETNDVASTLFDANALLIWTVVAYTLVYVAASALYFVYAKNKYKNDEFKRVKPKRFIKNSLYGLLGSLLTILTFIFIILRGTALSNNLIVFNPVDAFIICFTIVDLIVVGYAIKTLVSRIKAYRIQKQNAALKLDEDVADDGTN